MIKEYFSDKWTHLLSTSYWNKYVVNSEYIEISPIKNIFANYKGKGKKKELTVGKLYKAVKVSSPYNIQFSSYIIRNDNGVITKYHKKSMFIEKSTLRDMKLNYIL